MNWRAIKNFGQVKYFNISYIVIILVPLLVDIFKMLNDKFYYHLTIPQTLKWLYLASIIYAFAIAIYQYRCPSIIKEYENLQDYLDKNLKQFENKTPDLKYHIVLANLNKETQAETRKEIIDMNSKLSSETVEEEKIKQKIELHEKLNTVYSSSIQSFLTKKYNKENKKECFSYWTAGVLYIAGSIVILILLFNKTLNVFSN